MKIERQSKYKGGISFYFYYYHNLYLKTYTINVRFPWITRWVWRIVAPWIVSSLISKVASMHSDSLSLSWNSMALESLCNRPPQISRSLLFDQDIKFPDFKLGNMTIKISDDTHSTNLEPSSSSAIDGPLPLLIYG